MIQFSASCSLSIAAAMVDFLTQMCEKDTLGGSSIHICFGSSDQEHQSPTIMVSSRDEGNDRTLAVIAKRENFDSPVDLMIFPLFKVMDEESGMPKNFAPKKEAEVWSGQFPADECEGIAFRISELALNYITTGFLELGHTKQ